MAYACALGTPTVMAVDAHVHGTAGLTVAIDDRALVLHLESPLDNLVGFERAPKSDEERDKVRRAARQLREAGRLFQPTPEAGCRLDETVLSSPVLDAFLLGEPARNEVHGHHRHGHAEIFVEWRFACAHPERLRSLQVELFKVFPDIRRIRVQVAGPRGQSGATLTPTARKLSW
jgi:hypothetical protein